MAASPEPLETAGQSEHRSLGHDVNDVAIILVVHTERAVANLSREAVTEIVANGSGDIPHKVRSHAKAANDSCSSHEEIRRKRQSAAQADQRINPADIVLLIDVPCATGHA